MEKKQKVVIVTMMEVDPEYEDEFNRWYNEEHAAGFLKVPGVLSARRYKVVPNIERHGKLGAGGPTPTPTYLAIYEHESMEVQKSEAYQRVRFTPWAERIRPHLKNIMRNCYVQIFPEDDLGTAHP